MYFWASFGQYRMARWLGDVVVLILSVAALGLFAAGLFVALSSIEGPSAEMAAKWDRMTVYRICRSGDYIWHDPVDGTYQTVGGAIVEDPDKVCEP